MKIEDFDKNFKTQTIDEDGLVFYNCLQEPFSLHGFYKPHETGTFNRLPLSFAECEDLFYGVRRMMFNTSGGRVRFKTNSKVVAIKVELGELCNMNHMANTGIKGFDLYSAPAGKPDKIIFKKILFSSDLCSEFTGNSYKASYTFDDCELRDITINFPLYNDVKTLYIGLDKECVLEKATPYAIQKPIVYYAGSSYQGGCASRPGTNMPALLSRWLDADFTNLCFSGSDKGEERIAHHIASLEMSAFVYAYGGNAPSVEYYENTHSRFYDIVRKSHPDIPIIIPTSFICPGVKPKKQEEFSIAKGKVAYKTYEKAKANGENVYFIDGYGLIENPEWTVDTIHPTDAGFYEIAKKLYPLFKTILNQNS